MTEAVSPKGATASSLRHGMACGCHHLESIFSAATEATEAKDSSDLASHVKAPNILLSVEAP